MDRFYFEGFEPSQLVQQKADRLFDKVVEAAPSDSAVSALLEWDGRSYHCSIEIGSVTLPFAISTTHPSPLIAIDKAEFCMMRKIEKWKSVRFRSEKQHAVQTSKTG